VLSLPFTGAGQRPHNNHFLETLNL
jgi:hypothetical protein